MKRLASACLVVVVATVLVATTAFAQTKPEFQLGFKALADQVPTVAGEPTEAEHWGANGDSLQHTTTGLMVWRKADNASVFTDGTRTWANGPFGVQERANEERFGWEAQVIATPIPSPTATPTPSPTAVSGKTRSDIVNDIVNENVGYSIYGIKGTTVTGGMEDTVITVDWRDHQDSKQYIQQHQFDALRGLANFFKGLAEDRGASAYPRVTLISRGDAGGIVTSTTNADLMKRIGTLDIGRSEWLQLATFQFEGKLSN